MSKIEMLQSAQSDWAVFIMTLIAFVWSSSPIAAIPIAGETPRDRVSLVVFVVLCPLGGATAFNLLLTTPTVLLAHPTAVGWGALIGFAFVTVCTILFAILKYLEHRHEVTRD
jgi:hypothetical protein